MNKIINIKNIETIKNDFVNEETRYKFYSSLNRWSCDFYFYIIDEKIVSFCLLMQEDLKCGFLHYHIPNELRDDFALKYPMLNKKTDQIHYLYTAKSYRKQKIASRLLNFVFSDLKTRDFKFVWLICETRSTIYEVLGLKRFTELLDILQIKDDFLKDYQKIKSGSDDLSRRFGDMRLVKLL